NEVAVEHKESSQSVDKVKKHEHERGEWNNKYEFILSCVGLSVGLGNVWRFPYLAYDNGGAAFVIAYIVLQFLVGKPMYFMELVMGQYSGKGPTMVWNMNPCAKGVGISMALISLVVTIYYNVIMAYTLFYFFASMQPTLPWTVCKAEWYEFGCVEKTIAPMPYCSLNVTENLIRYNNTPCRCYENSTFDMRSYLEPLGFNCTTTTWKGDKPVAVAQLYFDKEVTKKSHKLKIDEMGPPLWRLSLCLLLSSIIVIFCVFKGIKTSGKVVYFAATFPYVILIILLIRGALLDGAIDGVIYFIVPKWEKLLDLKVWVAAAGQMFFSLSVSFGGIIMYGSYNRFKNNVYSDALLISMMDIFTSLLAGFVIFTTFGGMAKELGVGIEDVARSGYGLVFVAYPEALSRLPLPQLWSVLFFLMLYMLGLDSEFALYETFTTCLFDEFTLARRHKGFLSIGIGIMCYIMALPCVTAAGDCVVTIMDHFGADYSVLVVASCECVAVMWVYGARTFINDIEYMLGRPLRPKIYWWFCWVICAPLLISLLFLYRMIKYKEPEVVEGVPYPLYAQAIGWVLTMIVLSPIPAYFLLKLVRAKGSVIEVGIYVSVMMTTI
ncbi:hypothetical protein FSP39_006776, partial [Pinctada imbricata]